ncbi:hypothetical protein M7I_7487 [Glarea lozoyensis 74030]|uniref:Uncharacterized protein n=1 Tax=Glarea lozoyensis (strain ATCC 74030 / MF5533) TaxID=1104152 RepID=H0EXF2_GLAL7|nr:hypothetical protein M7I_7487 [Glarea lozoyensis 74030]
MEDERIVLDKDVYATEESINFTSEVRVRQHAPLLSLSVPSN